ncbi:hypothetical protein quinque_014328 [Culex quinquefasciatus]
MCDPEELGETSKDTDTLRGQVSKGERGLKSDSSDELFSQEEEISDNTVYIGSVLEEEGLLIEASQPNAWVPTPVNSETQAPQDVIQPTMVFEQPKLTQQWSFSQTDHTQNTNREITFSQIYRTQNTTHDPTQTTDATTELPDESEQRFSQTSIPLIQEVSEIPASIRNLYSSITEQYSDYCFSYTLAAQLCPELFPMNTHTALKFGLVLSLASIHKSSPVPPFHVIAIGADTSASNLLMTAIGQLARRYVIGAADPIAGGRVLEESSFVECGATSLARTGVCYIGDWAMQKPVNATRILREIESGRVIIENHAIAYPLECAIWTCWNYSRRTKQDLSTMVGFLNTFGIPIVLPEQTADAEIDFLLEQSLRDYDELIEDRDPLVPEEDVRQFFAMLYFQSVVIPAEIIQLLEEYGARTRVRVPEALSQSSLQALSKLTEAHTRLCFRKEATRLDALVAIMTCERFIHSAFSYPGNVAPLADSLESMDDLEQYLQNFDTWLGDFLSNTTIL